MPTLYILYGSATGNAESIAKDLAEQAPKLNPFFDNVICKPLETYKKYSKEWSQPPSNNSTATTKHGILLISSTTGNGDAPENASRFVRYVKRKQTAMEDPLPFVHCAFSVLGLGDTNYDQFCAAGKLLDRKMMELGGTRAKPLACADEATGLEEVVEPWVETVLQDLQTACTAPPTNTNHDNDADNKKNNETLSSSEQLNEAEAKNSPPDNADTKEQQQQQVPPSVEPSTNTQEDLSKQTATTVTVDPPSKSEFPLFLLYGSATGNAEHIAKDLAATYEMILQNPDAQAFFPSVVCCELDQFKKKCLPIWEQTQEHTQTLPDGTIVTTTIPHGVIIVASTTGNGDPPENCSRFTRFIKRKQTVETQPFRNVQYAVLGLGDTNYDQFCANGQMIDKKLAQLGGIRVKPIACADEATGLEEVVEPWAGTILSDITTACRGASSTATISPSSTNIPDTPKQPQPQPQQQQQEEEKKSEITDNEATITTKESMSVHSETDATTGVGMLKRILGLADGEMFPDIAVSLLPSLGASQSSCELFSEDQTHSKTRSGSFDDRATISSASSGALYYTINRPFTSSILASRYMTNTPTDAVANIAEKVGNEGVVSDAEILMAREVLNSAFSLHDPEKADRNGKRVIEARLSLPDDYSLEYQPGDGLGLLVPNEPGAVEFILCTLKQVHGILPTQRVSIDSNEPITVEEAIRNNVDLCSTLKSKRILNGLSQFATDPQEACALRFLASKDSAGERLHQEFIVDQRRSFVDILKDFPSCQNITLEGILSLLPSIPPRYYSVSSSPLDTQHKDLSLTVAFSVVDYLTPSMKIDGVERGQRRIHGLATCLLEAMCAPLLAGRQGTALPTVKIFPKPTADFRLPSDVSTPMILIGPGTGIAPFMGFMAHRQEILRSNESNAAANAVVEGTWRGGYDLEAEDIPVGDKDSTGLLVGADFRKTQQQNQAQRVGTVELYFGCRHANHDWLYQEEMKTFVQNEIVQNLYTAFSRDSREKQYVQTLLQAPDASKRLIETIVHQRGCVYICGDGNRMARDVQQTIAEVLSTQAPSTTSAGNGNIQWGKDYIERMKQEGRFLMDIWS